MTGPAIMTLSLLGFAAVGDLDVVVPGGVVSRHVPLAGDGVAVVLEAAGEALGEAGGVAPDTEGDGVDLDVVDAEDAAGVEVVHGHRRVRIGRCLVGAF